MIHTVSGNKKIFWTIFFRRLENIGTESTEMQQ